MREKKKISQVIRKEERKIISEILSVFWHTFKMMFQTLIELIPLVNQIKNLPYELIGIAIGIPTIVIIVFVKILSAIGKKV